MSDTLPSFRNMKPHFWVQGGLSILLFVAFFYIDEIDFFLFLYIPTENLTIWLFVFFITLTFLNFGHALLRKPEADQKSTWPDGPPPPAP